MPLQNIPADVPKGAQQQFKENYDAITHQTDNLFIFAADQKIEHLNDDFYGEGIDAQANNPQHIFEIAQQGNVGALATQYGLIARYGSQYPHINYVIKLNSKTNLIPTSMQDPLSTQLWSIADVLTLKDNGLTIRGVGYTLYLGSQYESTMLAQAAQLITQAHHHGLITILWVYPRGKSITKPSEQLAVDAAGVANALGADFAKLAFERHHDVSLVRIAAQAAGNTKIICAGGSKIGIPSLLDDIRNQLEYGAAGAAIGRNIFQRSRYEATELCKTIAELIYQ